MQYTVVAVYPDEFSDSRPINRDIDVAPATYVEWVEEAASPEEAADKAQAIEDFDRADAVVVAVFEGHHIDRLFNKSGERED